MPSGGLRWLGAAFAVGAMVAALAARAEASRGACAGLGQPRPGLIATIAGQVDSVKAIVSEAGPGRAARTVGARVEVRPRDRATVKQLQRLADCRLRGDLGGLGASAVPSLRTFVSDFGHRVFIDIEAVHAAHGPAVESLVRTALGRP